MPKQRLIIRWLGIGIILFGAAHLTLNLFIIISRYFMPLDQLRKIVDVLCRIFGPIAVRVDMDAAMLWVKVTVSSLFLLSGIGIIRYREWARRLLFPILALRVIYGFAICVSVNRLLAHSAIILAEFVILSYYFTRPRVREEFKQ